MADMNKGKDIFHLVLMTLIPPTSAATPTAPTSTSGKTTVASTTLKIQEVQVTHSEVWPLGYW